MTADERKWRKAEWQVFQSSNNHWHTDLISLYRWKLLLRPEYVRMPNGHSTLPLPLGLTVDKVLTDFFKYIKENIRMFVTDSYTSGNRYWEEFAQTMEVILTTPNAWEGKHQNRMREAAIAANLLVGDRVRERVRFVSEGEVT